MSEQKDTISDKQLEPSTDIPSVAGMVQDGTNIAETEEPETNGKTVESNCSEDNEEVIGKEPPLKSKTEDDESGNKTTKKSEFSDECADDHEIITEQPGPKTSSKEDEHEYTSDVKLCCCHFNYVWIPNFGSPVLIQLNRLNA